VFASDDADWVAGKDIPAPLADAVAPPTPIVVPKEGVVNVAKVELVVGNVRVVEPLTAGALNVTVPDVSPEITTDAIYIYPLKYYPP
jgi:hypothetical protein